MCSATQARFALLCATDNTDSSMSYHIISYCFAKIFCCAFSFSSVKIVVLVKHGNCSQANVLRSHGARFVAIIAASMSIVQLQQYGSISGDEYPRLVMRTSAAAICSLSGASHVL